MAQLLQAFRLDGVLLTEVEPTAPPSAEDLQALLDHAGGRLPPPYLDAMRRMDGFSGWFGGPEAPIDGCIAFDSCRSVLETAAAFGLREQGSPLLPVGGDGGGECFAYDLATDEWVVVTWVDLGLGEHEWRYPTLGAMLRGFLVMLDRSD